MGRYFEENYDLLKDRLRHMAGLVRQMIGSAIVALTKYDHALANDTVESDREVDRLENEIDELIIKLLALQQPMAIDLRFLITALKINNDLERMGDQAVNIAQNILILRDPLHARIPVDFAPIQNSVSEMVEQCIDAFNGGDAKLARLVCEADDTVDDFNRRMIIQLTEHGRAHPEDADRVTTCLLITRNLERIGDLCTNIAEDVIYYVEGHLVRHSWREMHPDPTAEPPPSQPATRASS